jgi:phospholipase D1/2
MFPIQVVIVDNQRAAVGGLDLSFGRWDTHTHPVADVHPTEFSWTLFPGQGRFHVFCHSSICLIQAVFSDYNNARVLDFKDVPNYVSNFVSIRETGRMPWHDVSYKTSFTLSFCVH